MPQGRLTGVGCVCRLHADLADRGRGRCKKTLNLGELDVAEASDVLKRWLLRGAEMTLASNGTTSRAEHRDVNPREQCMQGSSGQELDRQLEAVEAELVARNLL